MKRSALAWFVLWLACMGAGLAVVMNTRLVTDMSFFLPSEPSDEQQVMVGHLREGSISRLLMVAVGGADASMRADVSRRMRERLLQTGQFESVQNGEGGAVERELGRLLQHRYVLSPAVTPARFEADGLAAAVADTLDLVSSPAGLLFKPHFANDPTGELMAIVAQLDPASQPTSRAGVWSSRDGERAVLLLQTRALGSDTDGQAAAVSAVRAAFVQATEPVVNADLTLDLSGPGWFAVQARESIKQEVTRLALIGATGIWLLLFWAYRSLRLLVFGLVPVLSGALAGLVAVSLTHDMVFGVTVGFGSALIGEAVDYAIYYFVQAGQQGVLRWREVFWPTIRLGVMTTAIGFGTLLFAGFPGLAQLGLYALTGVVTAALVTRFLLPVLSGPALRVPTYDAGMDRGLRLLGQAHRLRPWVGVLALAVLAYLWHHRDTLWQADLSALSSVSAQEAATDARLRADLSAPDARYLVTVSGADAELVRQAAEEVGLRLDGLVDRGVIGGYDSPVRFLPSRQLQEQRLASLPSADELRRRLAVALVDAPIDPQRLEPFVSDVQAARASGPMTRADLEGSVLGLAVDSLLTAGADGRWTALMPLRPPVDNAEAAIAADEVRQALQGSPALFVDLKAEFDGLYATYLREAVVLGVAGVLAIALLLALALRSPRRLARVMGSLILTVAIVMAALHLLGVRLHLLHLVGLLLIVAVGSNYALFMDRAKGAGPLDRATLLSMTVATGTTVIGFGALATSSVPVLQAVGVTVAPGALVAFALAAVLVYPREAAR
jgi:predicted exporter